MSIELLYSLHFHITGAMKLTIRIRLANQTTLMEFIAFFYSKGLAQTPNAQKILGKF